MVIGKALLPEMVCTDIGSLGDGASLVLRHQGTLHHLHHVSKLGKKNLIPQCRHQARESEGQCVD